MHPKTHICSLSLLRLDEIKMIMHIFGAKINGIIKKLKGNIFENVFDTWHSQFILRIDFNFRVKFYSMRWYSLANCRKSLHYHECLLH